MIRLLLILICCLPIFGRRNKRQQPIATPQVQKTGKWLKTPHWEDGYWVKKEWPKQIDTWKLPANFADTYPFVPYAWEWPGYNGEQTWHTEVGKNQVPDPPKQWEREPNPDYMPGGKHNL